MMKMPNHIVAKQKQLIKERKIKKHSKEMFEILKQFNEYAPSNNYKLYELYRKVDDLLLKIEGGK